MFERSPDHIEDVTENFLNHLCGAAKDMESEFELEEKKGSQSSEKKRLHVDMLQDIAVNSCKYILKKRILPDVEEEDIKKIPKAAIIEILEKLPLFMTLFLNTRKGGPWDLKTSEYKKYQSKGISIAGKHYRTDITGNFLWGYAGAAADISEDTLKIMAGIGQKQMGTSDPKWTWEESYYDDPNDQASISAGYSLYRKYGSSGEITSKEISEVLDDNGVLTFNEVEKIENFEGGDDD